MGKLQEFRQIYHVKTRTGYEIRPFQPIVRMEPSEAAQRNQRWEENGYRLVPKNDYERYVNNAQLLN